MSKETTNKLKKAVNAAVTLCITAAVVMAAALIWTRGKNGEFTPPPFEAEAESGTPVVEDSTWSRVFQEGMIFSAHLTGILTVNGDSSDVYFTNDEGNRVWLKLRILDKNDNILGETGLLKPNEYVKTVKLDPAPKAGDVVRYKIMGYEPETYFSAGAVLMNTSAEVVPS